MTFKPKKTVKATKGLYFELDLEFHTRLKTVAQKHGISMKDFTIQALAFALDSIEIDGD